MRYKVGNQVRVLPIVDMPEFSEAKIGKLALSTICGSTAIG